MMDCFHKVSHLALDSFDFDAHDAVVASKTANLHIVKDGLGMLVPMPDRLASWIDDLGSFADVS